MANQFLDDAEWCVRVRTAPGDNNPAFIERIERVEGYCRLLATAEAIYRVGDDGELPSYFLTKSGADMAATYGPGRYRAIKPVLAVPCAALSTPPPAEAVEAAKLVDLIDLDHKDCMFDFPESIEWGDRVSLRCVVDDLRKALRSQRVVEDAMVLAVLDRYRERCRAGETSEVAMRAALEAALGRG